MENLQNKTEYKAQNKVQTIRGEHRKHKKWIKVVTVLASLTLFCTVYTMIMPAATESTQVYCGYEEYLAHTDDCYEKQLVLTCTNEDDEHVHSADCYEVQDVLICERPIHEHTLQCYSDPCADRETESEWIKTVERAEITGKWSDDIVSIAKTQLGYRESTANYYVLEDGETKKGYTRYGSWYGASYDEWSAMFCSFCLHYAEIPETAVPYEKSAADWVDTLSSKDWELYRTADEYEPVKGDLIFFDDNADGQADRVGIVTETAEKTVAEIAEDDLLKALVEEDNSEASAEEENEETVKVIKTIEGDSEYCVVIKTIEGDSEDCVAECSYHMTDERILGYAVMEETQKQEFTESTIEYKTEDGAVVTVTGNLPEGAEIRVQAVSEEVLAEIMEQVGAGTPVFAYDITIIDGEGNEWQPDELGVTVSITGIETQTGENEEIEVAHVPEEGEIETVESNTTEEGVEFEAKGFSVYVGYTVDFEYKNITYSIDGETSILLSRLFKKLKINKKVSDVTKVTFSDTTLVSVAKSGKNDWLLTSLEPFLSNETLVITFKDKSTITIKVTDDGAKDYSYEKITASSQLAIGDKVVLENMSAASTHSADTNPKNYLTDDTYENTNRLELDTRANATVWTIMSDWYLQNEETGQYLTVGNLTAGVSATAGAILGTYTYSGTTYFALGQTVNGTPYYLNDYYEQGTQVGGYSSLPDDGSYWNVYKVTEVGSWTTDSDTTVNVSLNWAKTTPSTGSITVTLLKDGTSTGKTLTLNSSNNWSGQFTGLAAGSYDIQYTTIDGYTYSSESSSSETSGSWTQASALESGKTYVLVRATNNVVQNSSGTALGNATVTVSGTTITGVTNAMKWIYNGTSLQNVATQNYLRMTSGSAATGTTSQTIVYENGRIRNNNSTKRYLRWYNNAYTSTTTASSGTTFTLYTEAPASTTLTFTITGTDTTSGGTSDTDSKGFIEKAPDHSKYIDAFRDNEDNPDTDLDDKARAGTVGDIEDLYRLYLDVGPESSYAPIDVLFVIDTSTSMLYQTGGDDAKDILGYDCWRSWALDTLLNGEDTSMTQATVTARMDSTQGETEKTYPNRHQQSAQYANGLISIIGSMNPENKIAVISFNQAAAEIQPWTKVTEDTVITYQNGKGTNYIAGLQMARECLSKVQNDGRKKIMIFLSDGIPNYYYPSLDDATLSGSTTADDATIKANIATTQGILNNYYLTDKTFNDLKAAGLEIYSIGLGSDFLGDSDKSGKGLLTTISTTGTALTSTNFSEIVNELDRLITGGVGHYTNLKVTDTLSDYVDFYTDDLDLLVQKITVIDGVETKTTLYQNGTLTTAGAKYIKTNGVVLDTASKKVSVDFLDDYKEEGSTTYRISFNVKTTERAYTDYKVNAVNSSQADGYAGVEGDNQTDFGGNETSSIKGGFYSNKSAIVEYRQMLAGVEGDPKSAVFDMPVIQVDTTKIEIESDPTKDNDGDGLLDKAPDHRKYIDAFRDGQDNTETDLDDKARAGTVSDSLEDLYRLYLDVGPESAYEPIDVLFVIDSSSSMMDHGGNDATDILGNTGCWRSYALDTLLNGVAEGTVPTSTTKYQRTKQYENGLVSIIGSLNPQNKIAVVRFSQTAAEVQPWTTVNENTVISFDNVSGTNYIAGLQMARDYLNLVKNDGRKKIMIFLSDGIPNYYMDSLDSTTVQGGYTTNISYTQNVLDKYYLTDTTFNDLKEAGLQIYTIGLGGDFDTAANTKLLSTIGNTGDPLTSTDFTKIMTSLETLVTNGVGHYVKLKITDTLSDYVDFYTDDLDFLIQRIVTDENGNETKYTLYENGALTAEGRKCIEPNGVTIDYAAKTFSVDFIDDYQEQGSTTYRTSFNVKTTQTAYDRYEANSAIGDGYGGVKGDDLTDYPNNATSSLKSGFHSNKRAIVEYAQMITGKAPGATKTTPFDHPVIQVGTDTPDVPEEYSFEHNKQIDYLGDGETNKDTDLTGTDFYRLYLDMTGKQEPVDLMIVVDGSGSMDKTDMKIGNQTGQARDTAITYFLNGSKTTSTSDGFLAYFLGLNSENRVSVVQFFGTSSSSYQTTINTPYMSKNKISYTTDSKVLLDWTGTNQFVDCANVYNSGTNYEAGLKCASVQFGDDDVKDNGHRKIMIFLSDGVPTYFLVDANDAGTKVYNSSTKTNDYSITSAYAGYRWGNGQFQDTKNYPYCKEPSKKAFDDFIAANPDVMVFTVGVSSDISATSESESQNPEVLQYMAQKGGGSFLSVAESMTELQFELESIFYPKDVTIQDTISKYVRFVGDTGSGQIDMSSVKVTMSNSSSTTVLYENGQVKNSSILESVTYTRGDSSETPTASTGTMTANFNSDYAFLPEYDYTLSFDVKTTETAYNQYYASGHNATGDQNSDYGTNTTSSKKRGFYSNDSATVTYNVCGVVSTEDYRKPVIQVVEPVRIKLTVFKTVNGAQTEAEFPFTLTVQDSSGNGLDLSRIQNRIPAGVTLKTKDGVANILEFTLSNGEAVEIGNIIPKEARLTLTETAHNGYSTTIKIAGAESFSGDTKTFSVNAETTVEVINTVGAVALPETGGSGTDWSRNCCGKRIPGWWRSLKRNGNQL